MERDDQPEPLDIHDILVVAAEEDEELEFEVVGLMEDDDDHVYVVSYNEHSDEFIVTDQFGNMLADEDLAQEILDDFSVLAEET